MTTATKVTTFPVIEVFGPVIQGEGAMAGRVTHFVRLGGCDYRCSWCDSMYAVDPAQVRANAEKLTADEIVERLDATAAEREYPWVTLSGGNPAINHRVGQLVAKLQANDWLVAVETQGSAWQDWLSDVDHLCVSPKPPSSGMVDRHHDVETTRFMTKANEVLSVAVVDPGIHALKIVVFDEADLEWAKAFIGRYPDWPAYLSVGTDQPDPDVALLSAQHVETVERIAARYKWLCEAVAADPTLSHVRVLPQLHVIAFGHLRGV